MAALRLDNKVYPVTNSTRRRYRFSILAVIACVALLSWGGLVTSIDAGLAVPDWPSSFGSYDPLATGFEDPNDPSARWWNRLPILAEHGHRLLGALVGLFTVLLALWTWRADERRWMRILAFAALALVIIQGVLGGLRVIWVSLDLAVVHALAAQLFFSLLVALALFTSDGWLRAEDVPEPSPRTKRLGQLAVASVVALYVQIVLGALLRHPGAGIDLLFGGIHATGAFLVAGLVFAVFVHIRKHFEASRLLNRGAWVMLGSVAVQFMLGFTAFIVLLVESQTAQRSALQVILNSTHLVVGALLMASAVCLALLSLRRPVPAPRESNAPEALALH
ncbi:MAG: heme A synthase [Rhodothermales bacterium]